MDKCNTKENIKVYTGGNNSLENEIKKSIHKAKSIDIIVSFIMETGIRLIISDLKDAYERGAHINILTGNYLNITQPSALYLIKNELGKDVDLRFYNEQNISFHPKAYIFHYEDHNEIYIGSSNISYSALSYGIEWNYKFNDIEDKESYDKFYNSFNDLFSNHSMIIDDKILYQYAKSWHKPPVYKQLEVNESKPTTFIPRGAQIEALYALNETRNEGANKALICAATGIGKTILAAFDSLNYKKILFVAHREEILKQAALSFSSIRNSDDYGFFNGDDKCINKSMIFASVSSLGKKEYLNSHYFNNDYFDYIVIDEFHHAVSKQYMNIIEYFKPQFLLGLTATPERMDRKNIYEICDYNVPYEISLKEGINRGMLVPFHYYGIYDETDYSSMKYARGKYNEEDLNNSYIGNKQRSELIYKHYLKYSSSKTLAFCCSRKHAEEMARDFNSRGIPSVAVYSNAQGEFSEERDKAINKLKNNEIKVIFSVDMFNEGVDIAEVDMVMFLRPTESPIVFLQQLGRGLRLYQNKEYLTVLDFIGNYANANKISSYLTENKNNISSINYYSLDLPDNCIADFDMQLIDLFNEMNKKSLTLKQQIIQEYYRIKDLLNGERPSRMDLFRYMDGNLYQDIIKRSKDNPFNKYLDFLHDLNELNNDELKLYNSIAKDFLSLIETTSMSKVYKMPILYAFYNNGDICLNITDEDVYNTWIEFFDNGTNWKDFDNNLTYNQYKAISKKKHLDKAKKMPIHFLKKSGKGFFVEKDNYALSLNDSLEPFINDKVFIEHFKDILDYRTIDYYRRRYKNEA